MEHRNLYYRLTEKHETVPIRFEEYLAWNVITLRSDKVVGQDEIAGYFISTMFLGFDHNFAFDGLAPMLFETMIFREGEWLELYVHRYPTWDEAERGHRRLRSWLEQGWKPEED